MTTTTLLTTAEIAKQLVEKCKKGENFWVMDNLYSPDIITIEENSPDATQRESKGIEACKKKGEMWHSMMEVHEAHISEPLVSKDEFSVLFDYDVTNKQNGQRFHMKEIAVYEVRNGKIWKEHFFYNMEGTDCQ